MLGMVQESMQQMTRLKACIPLMQKIPPHIEDIGAVRQVALGDKPAPALLVPCSGDSYVIADYCHRLTLGDGEKLLTTGGFCG